MAYNVSQKSFIFPIFSFFEKIILDVHSGIIYPDNGFSEPAS